MKKKLPQLNSKYNILNNEHNELLKIKLALEIDNSKNDFIYLNNLNNELTNKMNKWEVEKNNQINKINNIIEFLKSNYGSRLSNIENNVNEFKNEFNLLNIEKENNFY